MNQPQEYGQRVTDWIEEHDLMRVGETVLVACSGGRDSLALLHLLHSLRKPLQIQLVVACVNHGLRDVQAEVALVEETAQRLGLRFREILVDVARNTGSLQAAAREARIDALEQEAERVGAHRIATGHTKNDQAETLLFRLCRGSGLRGLGAMRPGRDKWIRPVLCLTRQETGTFLSDLSMKWMDDPSNLDSRFARVRIREHILPELEEMAPGTVERLWETAFRLQGAESVLSRIVGEALGDVVTRANGTEVALSVPGLQSMSASLRPLVIQRAAERAGLREMESSHIREVAQLLDGMGGTREVHLPGLRVQRVYDVLSFGRVDVDASPVVDDKNAFREEEIVGPGCYRIEDWVMTFEEVPVEEFQLSSNPLEEWFDSADLSFPLRLRAVKEGDRISPLGMTGRKKVSDVLIDQKVPREKRNRVWALTQGEKILWLVGLVRSGSNVVVPSTSLVWRVRAERVG